jgi:alkylation response protein AidB-like acyl-CoA dehydrogenase
MVLTPSQQELQASARHFAGEVLEPRAAQIDRSNEYPRDVVAQLARSGFMGLTLPQEYGGGGRPLADLVLVVEELAKVSGVVARIVVDANTAVQKSIVALGREEHRRKYLPAIVAGDKPAIAITEPQAGSAATALTTSARRAGDHLILNGAKRWITGAGVSGFYLVFVRLDERPGAAGIGAVLVDADTPGLRVVRTPLMMGLRGLPEGELEFQDCRIPASNIVAEAGDGFRRLMQCYNLQRVGAATVALGIAQGAFDLALDYAGERVQFDRPIGEFQGIQWMLADMHIKLQAARALVHAAATSDERGFPDKLKTATAKVFASEAAIAVVNDALQIFGAAGYSCDLPVERMVRDARMFTIGGGTVQMQRNLIGGELLGSRRSADSRARARSADA